MISLYSKNLLRTMLHFINMLCLALLTISMFNANKVAPQRQIENLYISTILGTNGQLREENYHGTSLLMTVWISCELCE